MNTRRRYSRADLPNPWLLSILAASALIALELLHAL